MRDKNAFTLATWIALAGCGTPSEKSAGTAPAGLDGSPSTVSGPESGASPGGDEPAVIQDSSVSSPEASEPRDAATAVVTADAPTLAEPSFVIGADISWAQEQEDQGIHFRDQGVEKDILLILKSHGFNYIRLRTFVDPKASNGYSARGYCDLAHTITMAKRVKAAGLGLLLDFHYSDNWADPGKQVKPAAWQSLSFDALTAAVHDYTKDAISQLAAAGARPDLVQIGNEITPGMLLPDGAIGNWKQLGALLKAGIAGVKEIAPATKIMLHIDRGGDNATSRYWFDNAIAQGVTFDVAGESCYPEFQGMPAVWKSNLIDLVARYPKLLFSIAEYSKNKQEANDIVFGLPQKKGLGTFIWEPTKYSEAIFDAQGNTLPLITTYDQIAKSSVR